ncbi:MAG TPA: helix-turn-helix domain-containing protein [Solirubrobacterales bacterium]
MELAARLRERRDEIEQTALTRVYAISDPRDVEDPSYTAGLRDAVRAALTLVIDVLDSARELGPGDAPAELLIQARNAARNKVPLDTVLRRYLAGFTLLSNILAQLAAERSVPATELQTAQRRLAVLFDRLVATASGEYGREADSHLDRGGEREIAKVRMLLEGEATELPDLGYELEAWHLGVIGTGATMQPALRKIAISLGLQVLIVVPEPELAWAWFGGREKITPSALFRAGSKSWPQGELLAAGEAGWGLDAWRLTHRQARAALPVAKLTPERKTAYADVALVAAMMKDDVLATSLAHIFLDPLGEEREGETLRQTLRAYLAAERNASSAAAALGVDRRTVSNRLRVIEERFERPLGSCGAELEAALQMDEFASKANVTVAVSQAGNGKYR